VLARHPAQGGQQLAIGRLTREEDAGRPLAALVERAVDVRDAPGHDGRHHLTDRRDVPPRDAFHHTGRDERIDLSRDHRGRAPAVHHPEPQLPAQQAAGGVDLVGSEQPARLARRADDARRPAARDHEGDLDRVPPHPTSRLVSIRSFGSAMPCFEMTVFRLPVFTMTAFAGRDSVSRTRFL